MVNGTELKVERIRRGVRQFKVAAALGITQSALCAIENYRRPVSKQQADEVVQAIRRLAAASPQPADERPT